MYYFSPIYLRYKLWTNLCVFYVNGIIVYIVNICVNRETDVQLYENLF